MPPVLNPAPPTANKSEANLFNLQGSCVIIFILNYSGGDNRWLNLLHFYGASGVPSTVLRFRLLLTIANLCNVLFYAGD